MDSKDLLSFFRKVQLFCLYGDEELIKIIEVAKLQSVNAGELIFDEGGPGDAFYIVFSGRVRIIKRGKDNAEVNIAVLTPGDQFGETALITDHPRNAAARAVEDSTLIAIEKQQFNEHIFSNPRLREHFDKFIRNHSIHNFIKSCTNLAAIPSKELRELVGKLTPELYRKDQVVFRQGAEADKFYIIETGKVKVVRWEGNEQEIINFLIERDFFGEKALIEKGNRFADIVCLTDCQFFSLSKEDFDDLIVKSSKLKKVIEERIRSYHTTKPPIRYQELIKQELAVHKDMTVVDSRVMEPPQPKKEKRKGLKGFAAFFRQRVRFPFIRQHDETTCGTTCIMMIAKYCGKNFFSNRLRELAHVDVSGASLANLASAAEELGFSARGMRLSWDSLSTVQLPCIVHWQGFHYIVVYRIDKSHVWVADPAIGLRKYDKEHFVNNWTGIALLLEPTPALTDQSEDEPSLKRFLQFIRPHKKILAEVLAASLLLNVLGLATPIFTQIIVDRVIVHHNKTMLNVMFAGMIIMLIFKLLTTIVRQYLIVHTSIKIDLHMLVFFYKHLLSLPLGYYKVRKVGDFVTRFGENLKIRDFMTNVALTILLDSIMIIVYLTLVSYYSVEMLVVVCFFVAAFVALTLIFTPILKRLNIEAYGARAESESHLIESIHAIETIKALNLEYQTRWKWEDKFLKSLNIDFRLYTSAGSFNGIGNFMSALGSAVILWFGALKVMAGALSVGELMAVVALMGSVLAPIVNIISAWDKVQQTMVSIERLNDVFEARSEFPEQMGLPSGIFPKDARGAVEMEKVYFRYGGNDSPYIISNINLKAAPGQIIAIVGRSGSGKSTLVRLLSRMYDVSEGKITIDGIDIKSIHLPSLRKLVGFVLQENFIFNATIRENICLGDPQENMEKIIEAAKLANAHDFIASLTLGYETRVGESGLQLSGGQKQRIAIARVIYSNPKILILDEATSSLDTESERAIQKNLGALLKNRTAFVIAHRLSTIRNASFIVVLDKGEIVEQGSHDDLMRQKGLYHYLIHQQLQM